MTQYRNVFFALLGAALALWFVVHSVAEMKKRRVFGDGYENLVRKTHPVKFWVYVGFQAVFFAIFAMTTIRAVRDFLR